LVDLLTGKVVVVSSRYVNCDNLQYNNDSIGKGKFTVDEKEYHVAINNGPNALHGGLEGFDKRIWTATVVSESPASVRLELVSPDGDQNYPGTLTTHITYTVNDNDELSLEYHATTDKNTIINLTNHSYFNLSGVSLNANVLDHQVTMTDEVKAVLECDGDCLPTGRELSWSEAPWMNFSVSFIQKVCACEIAVLNV
jgi:aldose 1-epimerase